MRYVPRQAPDPRVPALSSKGGVRHSFVWHHIESRVLLALSTGGEHSAGHFLRPAVPPSKQFRPGLPVRHMVPGGKGIGLVIPLRNPATGVTRQAVAVPLPRPFDKPKPPPPHLHHQLFNFSFCSWSKNPGCSPLKGLVTESSRIVVKARVGSGGDGRPRGRGAVGGESRKKDLKR